MTASVELQNIQKSFGAVDVIKAVNLQVQEGEFIVLVGPSGCGKSTLLRSIAGLEGITSGRLLIDGKDLTQADPASRGVAMVFQSYALYPHMTVEQNLGFGLMIAGESKERIARRVREVADILHLGDYLQRKPKALSGGQRQRVAIGRALARKPRIFLFDEPLSNLDASLRAQMRVELATLHQALGNTMIYVTHDQVEAMTLATRMVVMQAGRVEQVGSPLALYNQPATRFVASFLGQPPMNFLQVASAACSSAQSELQLAAGCRLLLHAQANPQARPVHEIGIRPEDLQPSTASHALPLVVEVLEQLGSDTVIYGRTADGQRLSVRLQGQANVAVGSSISVAPVLERVILFDREGRNLAMPASPSLEDTRGS